MADPSVTNPNAPPLAWAIGFFPAGQPQSMVSAIGLGDAQAVQRLLGEGVSPNLSTADGMGILYLAVREGHVPVVEVLLKAGANPNARFGNEPVTQKAVEKYATKPRLLELLLEHGADPNTRNQYREPMLMDMAVKVMISPAYHDGMRLLARYGADLNILDRTRSPVILEAAIIEHWDSVWTLIELGADWRVVGGGGLNVPHQASLMLDAMSKTSPMYAYVLRCVEHFKASGAHWPPLTYREVYDRGLKRID